MSSALRIYNSLTKRVEQFAPLVDGKVGVYCCGPTVYDYVHIGNLRAAMFFDLLRRTLRFFDYDVTQVVNITDVDDKIIRALTESGKSLKEFTDFYRAAYLADLETLGIESPDILPRATEEIDAMVSIIERLLDKGHAYRTDSGDVYFKISSDPGYGAIAGLDRAQLKPNADGRLDVRDNYEKEDAADFALWKAYSADDGDVFWETSLGKGRPGWHIECSAMATRYLGETFDMHCGGIDLIFPHHTNEIAQSECAHAKQFARYWMHNGHLVVDGVKMSKSLGNFFTLRDLLERGLAPSLLRLELLRVHYRAKLDFRPDDLVDSKQLHSKIRHALAVFMSEKEGKGRGNVEKVIESFIGRARDALADDLNIAELWAALNQFLSHVNAHDATFSRPEREQLLGAFREVDAVLGLEPMLIREEKEQVVPESIQELARRREEARRAKDFALADSLRAEIVSSGYEVKDSPEGFKLIRL